MYARLNNENPALHHACVLHVLSASGSAHLIRVNRDPRWIFGTATGFKGNGLRAAMGNGVSTGTTWGCMSAAFCGVEVLAREIRGGTVDKWNNMIGACRCVCTPETIRMAGSQASCHQLQLHSASLPVCLVFRI